MPEGRIDVMGGSDAEAPPRLPELGAVGALRWVWRQLTSMRVALMLLMLLAVVALPGSVLPQRPQDPAAVATYLADNPGLGLWLDRLGLFDVYASVWFSAVYLLLFVSLIGCIVPRIAMHGRALRARPPRAPRRFDRFGVRDQAVVDAPAAEVLAVATRTLAGPLRALPRFRVDTGREDSGALTVSAERGYLRESGNIVFHLALVGLLVAVATGQMLPYRGQAIVVEGRGFANAVTGYDTFAGGTAGRLRGRGHRPRAGQPSPGGRHPGEPPAVRRWRQRLPAGQRIRPGRCGARRRGGGRLRRCRPLPPAGRGLHLAWRHQGAGRLHRCPDRHRRLSAADRRRPG